MDHERHHIQTELSRVLVAADAGVDPHRLVTLCCRRPDSERLSVSLLVPLGSGPEARSRGGVVRAALMRKAATLLDAAGIRLDDFVLADEDPGVLDDLAGSGEFDAVLVCTSPRAALNAGSAEFVGKKGRRGDAKEAWISEPEEIAR